VSVFYRIIDTGDDVSRIQIEEIRYRPSAGAISCFPNGLCSGSGEGEGMNPNGERSYFSRAILITALAAVAIILLYLLWHLAHILLVIFAGILLAVFLDGLSTWTRARLRLPRFLALPLIVVILLGLLLGAIFLFGPRLAEQFGKLAERIPEAIDSIRDSLGEQQTWSRWLAEVPVGSDLLTAGSAVLGGITGAFSTVLGVVTSVFIIIFVGIYLAKRPISHQRSAVTIELSTSLPRSRLECRTSSTRLRR
jgi:predicted PurR-regulated permease PerM